MDRATYNAALDILFKIEALVDSAIEQLNQIKKEEELV